MKYYYYSIKNKLNGHQYIGITLYPENRKAQHYRQLKAHKHNNPHLQYAFDKFGEENFIFSILETREYDNKKEAYDYEAFLIEKYDTIINGYNCNPGGYWSGPQVRFSKQEVFYIKSAAYFNKKVSGVLGEYFNYNKDSMGSIIANRTYKGWGEEFDKLSELEKSQIYDEFCEISNFEIIKYKSNIHQSIRKYTKEEVFLILNWCETKFTTAKKLCDFLKIDYPDNPNYKCANKFRSIREGIVYKDYNAEYKKLSPKEKEAIQRLYTEKYIE